MTSCRTTSANLRQMGDNREISKLVVEAALIIFGKIIGGFFPFYHSFLPSQVKRNQINISRSCTCEMGPKLPNNLRLKKFDNSTRKLLDSVDISTIPYLRWQQPVCPKDTKFQFQLTKIRKKNIKVFWNVLHFFTFSQIFCSDLKLSGLLFNIKKQLFQKVKTSKPQI